MIRKFVTLPTSSVLAAVVIKNSESDAETKKTVTENSLSHYQCKATELPLYAPLHSYDKPQEKEHSDKISPGRYAIESGVRVIRTEVQKVYQMLEKQTDTVKDYISEAKDKTLSTIDYLHEPHNILPRTGAIAIGGLSGFIFAARGGFIKKVFYTTAGSGVVASICYPKQAEQFAREALFEARKGYAITYNFVKGVKPGEGVPTEPINKFPTNLQEVKFVIFDLYEEAKDTLFPEKK